MAEDNVNLTALDNMISHLKNTNLITSSTFSPSKLPPKPLSMFSYKRPPSPVEGDMGTYTVDEFVQKYKNDPELRKLPLPNFVYEKYGIPKPEVLGLNTYLIKSVKSCMIGGWESETREADNKGIRKMPYLSTVEGVDLSGNITTYMSTFTD